MDAGKMSMYVRVESKGPGFDGAGQPIEVWTFVKNKWVQPKTSSGMASIAQSATNEGGLARSLVSYSLRGRYDPTVDANMRIVHIKTGLIFNIRQVRHDLEKMEWTDYVCEQGA